MSKLIVKVVRVNEILPHPNADRMEIVPIDGWQCLVRIGDFAVGDLAIYIPIDACIPQALIEKYAIDYLKNGDRVRAVKLRGIPSYGILLKPGDMKVREGQDVAEELGITKWEPPVNPNTPREHKRKGKNIVHPDLQKYTDIDNLRNYPWVLQDGEEVILTEKLHGTNFRVGMVHVQPRGIWQRFICWLTRKQYEYVPGSHNTERDFSDEVYGFIGKRFIGTLTPNVQIFGEIIGEGIQDLTYGRKNLEVYLFDVMVNGKYLDYDDFVKFCDERGFPRVPELYRGPWRPDLTSYAYGKSTLFDGHMREGVVIKPAKERMDPRFGRVVLKYVSDDYLTRKNGTEYH